MSKSARSLWIAARKNGDVLPVPEPLPGMSEPYFASLLFEHNCFVSVCYRKPSFSNLNEPYFRLVVLGEPQKSTLLLVSDFVQRVQNSS